MTTREAGELAAALPGSHMRDHFGSDAFYVRQIFATVWHDQNAVNLNLNLAEQQRFLMIDGEGFVQIDNAWGRKGWTRVHLEFVEPEQFTEALRCAWAHSAKATHNKTRKKTRKKKES
jgi:hypothetical protein